MKAYVECPTTDMFIDGLGLMRITISYDAIQDLEFRQALYDSDRTGPLLDLEIKEWQEMDEKLEGMMGVAKKEAIIKKLGVRFFREDNISWDGESYEDDGRSPYAWPGDWGDNVRKEPPPNYEFEK